MSRVSYKKLWKLLIDKDMKKKDLRAATGISSSSMAKLGKMKMLPLMCLYVYVMRLTASSLILWNWSL